MRFALFAILAIALLAGCVQQTGMVSAPAHYPCAAGAECPDDSTRIADCPAGTVKLAVTSATIKCQQNETPTMNRIVVMETTMGTIKIELFDDKAPITSKNFADLVGKGFYNNLSFHRVIADFMLQGGDPKGDGTGGPGYTIKDEFGSGLKHSSAGTLSMANAGPNTGGSQFFITLVPTPWLDGKHAIFGKVIEGMDVVEAIGAVSVDSNDRPRTPVVMKRVFVQA